MTNKMANEAIIIKWLRDTLPENKFRHSIGTTDTAIELAAYYGGNLDKIRLSALLHDCSRYMTGEEMIAFLESRNQTIDWISRTAAVNLLHAKVSRYLACEIFGIGDMEVLSSIEFHTLGRCNMSLTEKIVFVSDYIEPGRHFQGVENVREMARKNLDLALISSMNGTINYLLAQNRLIHPDLLNARNDVLRLMKWDDH